MKLHDGHVLGAAALIAPTLSVFAPLGLAPLLSLVAVAALCIAWRTGRLRGLMTAGPLTLFGGLLLWSAASLLWAPVPVGIEKLPRFAGLIASGVVVAAAAARLEPAERAVFRRLLVAGVAAGFAFLVFERLTGAALSRLAGQGWATEHEMLIGFNRGATVLALMLWPAILPAFPRHPRMTAAAAIAALALLASLPSVAAWVGLGIGMAAFAVVRIGPQRAPRVIAAVAVVYIAGSPMVHAFILTPENLHLDGKASAEDDALIPGSSYHRILIWNFTADRILERPVLGWGFDSSRTIPGGDRMLAGTGEVLPLHPHNGALQLWLELGMIGALLGAALAVWSLNRLTAWPAGTAEPAAATALFATGLLIVCVSYGLWQSWWLATLFFAVAFVAAARGSAPAPVTAPAASAVAAPHGRLEAYRR